MKIVILNCNNIFQNVLYFDHMRLSNLLKNFTDLNLLAYGTALLLLFINIYFLVLMSYFGMLF